MSGAGGLTLPALVVYNGGVKSTPKTEAKEKNPAAVAMGKLRAQQFTPEYQSAAGNALWKGVPRCGCGCGLTLGRAKYRHPARAFLLVEEEAEPALAG